MAADPKLAARGQKLFISPGDHYPMSTSEIAFLIGLFGSVHCIGMCGPLAFAVPSFDRRWWRVVLDKISYNAGRIITYSFLGLIIGLLGRQLWLAGLQQGVSIVSGLLII